MPAWPIPAGSLGKSKIAPDGATILPVRGRMLRALERVQPEHVEIAWLFQDPHFQDPTRLARGPGLGCGG